MKGRKRYLLKKEREMIYKVLANADEIVDTKYHIN